MQEKRVDAIALKQTYPGMTLELGVAAAFELSWEVLDESARRLAALLSLFALAEIPWILVEACLPDTEAEDLQRLRNNELVRLHLLERTGQELYQLHQLLREFFAVKRRLMPRDKAMKQTFCQVMVAEARKTPQKPTLEEIQQVTPFLPHIVETATTLKDWLTDDDLIVPFTGISSFYKGQGTYTQALPWLEQCREVAKAHLGANHLDVATSVSNLANLYELQGRYDEAEPLYRRVMVMMVQQLRAKPSDVAISLNNLANLYQLQGRYSEAEPLFLSALKISAQPFYVVATSLNNLAIVYESQGRYSEAEPLYETALGIRLQHLGENHPDTAASLNNLASLYKSQGRYSEAEPLYRTHLRSQEGAARRFSMSLTKQRLSLLVA